ncbi:hypothetical protein D3P07_20190 [Paenibacillus sp. 1011MAR3C5]|uniref:DUF4097 family beta strand repeat-containing protein n=1 Tax=Paenibacillus sp. 1011MAR3C5 TaxID=1675787 RepID=UPI000E6C7853|nr:DUF4097 family beta strand repeat-containing protein [Paenibacillus sp. 1011MAR3C5]RJE85525.1 hypothetical protein D3P07_20190 [Paenibacillus sp. 1011MAR3C5]
MKSYQKISLLVTATMLAIALTACSSTVNKLTDKVVIGEGSGSGEVVSKGKHTFQANEFESIKVVTEAMLIDIVRSKSEQAEVELMADSKVEKDITFNVAIKNDVLEIETKEKNSKIIGDNRGERRLIISLPEKQYDKVTINNNFGAIEGSQLNMNTLNVKNDVGSIRLSSIIGAMHLETATGDIQIDGVSLNNDLIAKTEVGTIRVQLNESPAAADVSLKSEVGNVASNLEAIEYTVNTKREITGTIGTKGPRLEASVSVGSVTVEA